MTQYTEQEYAILRENEDGSISLIPKDPANSDYAEYLNPSEAETI
jgi:hypothetical protein